MNTVQVVKSSVKNNATSNNSLDVRAKQLLFKNFRVKLGVARIRFRPTSTPPFGIFSFRPIGEF
jgi:hypothetical protein